MPVKRQGGRERESGGGAVRVWVGEEEEEEVGVIGVGSIRMEAAH